MAGARVRGEQDGFTDSCVMMLSPLEFLCPQTSDYNIPPLKCADYFSFNVNVCPPPPPQTKESPQPFVITSVRSITEQLVYGKGLLRMIIGSV